MTSSNRTFAQTTFAVVDVETTGVDPRHDRVVEVACVVVRDGERLAAFDSLVDPGRPIPAIASAVHHLTNDDVRGAPRLDALRERLRTLTDGAVVVAHNLAFDLRFLPFLADRDALCSMRFARMVVPDAPNHKNHVLRYHLGIDAAATAGAVAHRALGDAIVTSAILLACVRRYLASGGRDDVTAAIAAAMRPVPLVSLPFGRHRGEPLAAVPRDYLAWLLRASDAPADDVTRSVRAELARRDALAGVPDAERTPALR